MPLLVTPRQLSQRGELYQQLSQLLAAGIGLPQAIDSQRRSPPSRSFRAPLSLVSERLTEGSTFYEALLCTGKWLPAFDGALLNAGERSGRLPDCFKLLARHYENSADLLRKMISSLIYPAVLFHMAILISPLPQLVRSGNLAAYAAQTIGILVPLYAAIVMVLYATQSQHGEGWRSLIERVTGRIPILGKARRNLALARLSSALEALISAGVTIIEAWDLAAAASGSPALRREVESWKPDLLSGVTPAEVVSQSREFPETFASLYHTGEVTGSLDDTLRRLHGLYQSEGSRQLQAFADWTPKLVYFGVALMVAWQVIRFWTGYFEQINQTISF